MDRKRVVSEVLFSSLKKEIAPAGGNFS